MQTVVLVLIAVAGTCVVAVRQPARQIVVVSIYGLLLAVMFFAFAAPDVSLSEIAVGAVALPLLTLLALAKVRKDAEERSR